MKAALLLLALSVTPTTLVFAWLWADSLMEARVEARRRAEQDREADAVWLASLADEPTPVFDRMCFERWEAEL